MKDKSVRYEKPAWPSDEYRDEVTSAVLRGPGNVVAVPIAGAFLVVDGRVMKASVDQQGYAGPQVHLIVTDEPWEIE